MNQTNTSSKFYLTAHEAKLLNLPSVSEQVARFNAAVRADREAQKKVGA